MKIMFDEGGWSWAAFLQSLHAGYGVCPDNVVFCCRDGRIDGGNLLLLSGSSKLLQNIMADLPAYQALVEKDAKLNVVLPDVDVSTVEQWIHFVQLGTVTVSGRGRVEAFTEFLEKIILFTGDSQSFPNPCSEQQEDLGIEILSVSSLVEAEVLIDIDDPKDFGSADLDPFAPRDGPPNDLSACYRPPAFKFSPGTSLSIQGSGRKKKIPCPECPKAFPVMFDLYRHSARCHYRNEMENVSSTYYYEQLGCSICNQKLQDTDSRVVHFGATHQMILRYMDEEMRMKYGTLVTKLPMGPGVALPEPKKKRLQKANDDAERLACPECHLTFPMPFIVYRHAARHHYFDLIASKCSSYFDDRFGCVICNRKLMPGDAQIVHLGATHTMILQFMDEEMRRRYVSLRSKSLEAGPSFKQTGLPRKIRPRGQLPGPPFAKGHAKGFTKVLAKKTEAKALKPVDFKNLAKGDDVSCPECHRTFSFVSAVYKHSSTIHYRNLIEKAVSLHYDEREGCDICNRKIPTSTNAWVRKIHKLEHFGARHKMILQFMDDELKGKYLALGTLNPKQQAISKEAAPVDTEPYPRLKVKLEPLAIRPEVVGDQQQEVGRSSVQPNGHDDGDAAQDVEA